jgi:hypothetical protein
MIFIRLVLLCFGLPVALITIGVLWLWLGNRIVSYVFFGG